MITTSRSILKVIAYFNVFNYPVKKDEIISFLDADYNEGQVNEALDFLLEKEIIYRFDGFYTLQNNYSWIQRRKDGNKKAIAQLQIAEKVTSFLSGFPYIRGIAVSGSLSKHFADERSDIDLFLIAAPNRLWIARTCMHLFKKLTFLVHRQHWFCMNYYIDENALEIREKNIFTATEIVTVLPMRGKGVFDNFIGANLWVKNYFPQYIFQNNVCKKTRKGVLKSFTEMIFNNKLGDRLDDLLMKITLKRWQKKTVRKRMNNSGILMGMDGGKHYSKPVPAHLQEKVLVRFKLKMEQLLSELETIRTASAV